MTKLSQGVLSVALGTAGKGRWGLALGGESPGEEGGEAGAGVWHAHFLGPHGPCQDLSIWAAL